MNFYDHIEQERRRVERYSDLSRSAFAIGMISLALVGAFAVYMLLPQ